MWPIPNLWVYGAVLAGGVAIGTAGGWHAQGVRKDIQIETMKRESAEQKATDATDALQQLSQAAARINDAAKGASTDVTALNTKLDTIRKEIKNAKPLPVDCVPDAVRMRNLSSAVEAANDAAAGRKPSQAVR